MAQNIDYYIGLWSEMIANDKDKIEHFKEIDQAIEFGYSLPPKLAELPWMRNIQSTLPTQVIVVGTKILCTIEPTFFIQPLNAHEGTIKLANEKEQNLLWQFHQMEKRTEHGLLSDIVESALRYDSVACFTVPVNWQIEGQEGKLPSRYKAAMNQGGFITTVENPKDIHARYSPLGLDMVLNTKVMRARDAVYFYGEKASALKELIDAEEEEMYVSVFDYWNYDDRITRISHPSKHQELVIPTSGWIMNKGEMELPFLPWSVFEGGTSLATGSDHKVRPLLGPIVHTKQLELQNIVQSYAFSEATGYAAAPRYKITSHSGDTVEIRYAHINQPVILKPGEDIEEMKPPAIDGNLLVIFDRIDAAFSKLTGLRALAELDSPGGTAFATVNAQIKQATTALNPAKKLAERILSSIGEIVLRWTAHTGDPLVGYGSQDGSMGVEYKTKPEHIDPKELYVEARLSHHIPTDELQQINAVTILMKEVGISFVDAAKRLDIANPEELLDRFNQEQLDKAELGIAIKKLNAEADLEIQKKQMQLESDFQQKAMAQQIQMEQAQGGGENAESQSQARMAQGGQRTQPSLNPQTANVQGQGANPNRGGLSPNVANPEGFTKEGATGQDRKGEAI